MTYPNKLSSPEYQISIPNRENILEILNIANKPIKVEEIFQNLGITDVEQQKALQKRLNAMEKDGQVICNKQKNYALPEKMDLIKGTVIGHKDGFGFLSITNKSEDLFIPHEQMQKILHGDFVLAQIVRKKQSKRTDTDKEKKEIRIVRIIENNENQIVGRYFIENGLSFVVPDDNRINRDILIPHEYKLNARMGEIVVVELMPRKATIKQPIGKIIEILGEKGQKGIAIEIAIRNHKIPHIWPDNLENDLKNLADEVPDLAKKGKVDLTKLPLITIDGEDARDFDDAVYCKPLKSGGWTLWVAIADVSFYVPHNSNLDKEAEKRGNSVYFPNRVIPMLPEKLSNGLCSLNPKVDRLCMVAEININANGEMTEFKFYEAIMNSFARLTYTKVEKILQKDQDLITRYQPLVEDINNLYDLYKALQQARTRRGAISFETTETKFIYNAHGTIERIEPLIRNDAHKIIEECMILANVAAASYIEQNDCPSLYRIHLNPPAEKLKLLRGFLKDFGLSLGGGMKPEPKDYEHLMTQIIDRPDSELIQTMLLRSMQQATYSNEDMGHFGLSLGKYTHFTSPIRRYPDLVVHRTIKYILKHKEKGYSNKEGSGEYLYQEKDVNVLGFACSDTERRADEATREVTDWLKCEYMQDHIGAEFNGIISGVIGSGFFVKIPEFNIDGFVHVSTLLNDYYIFDNVKQKFIGQHTRVTYKIGATIKIKVESVLLDEKKINFILAGQKMVKNNVAKKNSDKNMRVKTKNRSKRGRK